MAETYLEYHFIVKPVVPGNEILIAELGELGFESFVEQQEGLLAYIRKEASDTPGLEELFILRNPEFDITYSLREIEQVNWNEEWEKNFDPIEVNDKCVVRAPFHEPFGREFELVIEPKMSFGTGHHETTLMMMQMMFDVDFERANVLDMGCGTGVLAILAEKLGAASIDAVDIDDWCVENALENAERNQCSNVEVWKGDIDSIPQGKKYQVIIANINRNILQEQIPFYSKMLMESGTLLLSGFYKDDLEFIGQACTRAGLRFRSKMEKNNWVAAKFVN